MKEETEIKILKIERDIKDTKRIIQLLAAAMYRANGLVQPAALTAEEKLELSNLVNNH